MAEMIDRAAALKCLEGLDALMKRRAETEDKEFARVQVGITLATAEIEALPTIDAVPVVRCRECVHCQLIPANKRRLFADGVKQCVIQRGDEIYGVSTVWPDAFCNDGQRMDADAPERADHIGEVTEMVGKDGQDV